MGSVNTTNITHINLLAQYYVDVTAAYMLCAVYTVVGAWCVLANCFMLTILLKYQALHTHANIFVANIAASDLCVGLCIIFVRPFNLLTHVTLATARMSCFVYCFCAIFSQIASAHALFCATAERYVKICHPFRYQSIVKTSVIVPVLLISWTVSFLYGCIVIGGHWNPESLCQLISTIDQPSLIAGIPYFLILLIFLGYFNLKIFATVQRHRRQIRVLDRHQSELTTDNNIGRTKLIGVLVLFNFISYVPFVLSVIIGLFVDNNDDAYIVLDSFTALLMYINNVANPVIFGWKDKTIRKHAIQLLGRKHTT